MRSSEQHLKMIFFFSFSRRLLSVCQRLINEVCQQLLVTREWWGWVKADVPLTVKQSFGALGGPHASVCSRLKAGVTLRVLASVHSLRESLYTMAQGNAACMWPSYSNLS
mmetsp:Transcript_74472/g.125420  ORF Transcript_74472/g.125420 Transcript_74472/m.125420 type:complete len:110 (-) Transcript_74472:1459-1788(-)